MIDWWLENTHIDKQRSEEIVIDDISNLENELKKRIPCSNFPHHLTVEKDATTLITKIFDLHVDEDTLIITSSVEHPSVQENVKRFPHHVEINYYYKGVLNLNIDDVKKALMKRNYKKALIYIIGTQNTTGEVTPQKLYIKLLNYLKSRNIETTTVCDDVHGMYFVPRDYSIFDYIIGTAHALIRTYDMGILWSKTNNIGIKAYNWISDYIKLLDVILSKKDKLFSFSNVMKEELYEYLTLPYFEYEADTVPYIFSIKVKCNPKIYNEKMKEEYFKKEVEINIDEPADFFYLRMRAAQYITKPELLKDAICMVKQLFDKVIINEETV